MIISGHAITNLIIAISGALICLFSLEVLLLGGRKDQTTATYMTFCFICLMIYNLCLFHLELAKEFKTAPESNAWRVFVYLMGFGTFLYAVVTAYIVSRYMLYIAKPPARDEYLLRHILNGMVLLYLGLLLLVQFTGNLIYVDSAGTYSEGRFGSISYVMISTFMLIDLVLLVKYKKNMTNAQRNAFGVYFGLPMLAILIRVMFYLEGVYIVALASSLSVAIFLVIILKEQNEAFRKQELKNEQLKMDILLGQIQPHFLFNVLYVIQEICSIDPELASNAIAEFSKYLRHNMDSLSISTPIPFLDELEHAKHYVSLQRLRFGDALDVKYDLACTDFRMPTLTLQPIVENAVRYGIRKKASGEGSVVIATREYDDRYEIEVRDDGPGFDQSVKLQDGISHVGLNNVRQRLQRISGGELKIDSELGKGTTVRMILPKNQ